MEKQSYTMKCTVTGTLLTILANISSADIVKTIILAALGATVSFMVSLALKWIIKKRRTDKL